MMNTKEKRIMFNKIKQLNKKTVDTYDAVSGLTTAINDLYTGVGLLTDSVNKTNDTIAKQTTTMSAGFKGVFDKLSSIEKVLKSNTDRLDTLEVSQDNVIEADYTEQKALPSDKWGGYNTHKTNKQPTNNNDNYNDYSSWRAHGGGAYCCVVGNNVYIKSNNGSVYKIYNINGNINKYNIRVNNKWVSINKIPRLNRSTVVRYNKKLDASKTNNLLKKN